MSALESWNAIDELNKASNKAAEATALANEEEISADNTTIDAYENSGGLGVSIENDDEKTVANQEEAEGEEGENTVKSLPFKWTSLFVLLRDAQQAIVGITDDILGSGPNVSLGAILTEDTRLRGLGTIFVILGIVGFMLTYLTDPRPIFMFPGSPAQLPPTMPHHQFY
jgi:hypothetical protein